MFGWIKRLFKSEPEPTLREPVEHEPVPRPEEPTIQQAAVISSETTAGQDPYPHLKLAIKLTGAFEGAGFQNVAGDFDGMGVSAGILQWNLGQGTLQRVILKKYVDKYGASGLMKPNFPQNIHELPSLPPVAGVAYARKNMLKHGKLKPEWRAAWLAFLGRPEVIQLQIEGCHAIAAQAKILATAWGYEHSSIAFCFFFDIVTQNGSMKGVTKAPASRATALKMAEKADKRNQAVWLELINKATAEQLVLFQAGYARARLSRAQYFQDVFSRKGTLALGKGWVHGKLYIC